MRQFIIFTTLMTGAAHAALSPTIVKDSALKFHPTVLAALESYKAAESSVDGARGAFDTKIVSDYKRQAKTSSFGSNPGYNMTLSRTQIEKGLRFANSKVYVGTEQQNNVNGILAPIYNTGNPAGQYGNYTIIGGKVSLWKNFTIDPDRAALNNAKYDAKMARFDKTLTNLDIGRLGQFAYWQWVTARKIKDVYENLLNNGETRNEFLSTRSKRGDIAQIIVTENEQYVANRKGSLQAAKERLLRAEFDLSLFYRDEHAQPIIPSEEETFEDYPEKLSVMMENLDLSSSVDDLLKNRPDMKNLALNVAKSEIDLELAKQDLRPQIDVTTEYFKRTIDHRPEMPLDYLMVLASVSIPIERNLGNGNIGAARARKMVAEKQMNYGQQTYKNEVLALRQALLLQLEQVNQAEIEYRKAKELVVSETYKFKSGGGNLFLVNLREEAQASAEAGFHESRLAFMNTLLTYQAMIKTVE